MNSYYDVPKVWMCGCDNEECDMWMVTYQDAIYMGTQDGPPTFPPGASEEWIYMMLALTTTASITIPKNMELLDVSVETH